MASLVLSVTPGETEVPSRANSPYSIFARIILVLLAGLLSLVLSRATFNGYDLPKVSLLRFAVICLLVVSVTEAVSRGRWHWRSSGLELPLAGLFFATVLSTVFSIDPLVSLLGDYARQEGLLTLAGYILVFLFAVNYLCEDRWRELLIDVWLGSATLVALYGVFQHFGLDLFQYSGVRFFELERSFATLGNPVRLSTYLVLTFPLAFSRSFVSRGMSRLLAIVASSLILPAIVFTYSRAGWIGLFVAVLLFAFLMGRNVRLSQKREALMIMAGIAVLTVSLALLPHSLKGKYDPGERLLSLVAVSQGSVATRLEIYRAAVKAVPERSLVGHGPSTFRYVFHKYRSLRSAILEKDATYDRAHSEVLQVASDLGLVGLLMYLWLMIALGRKGYELLARGRDSAARVLLAGELAGIGGYLVAVQFSFGGIGETTMFWVLAGLLLGTASNSKSQELSLRSLRKAPYLRVFFYLIILAVSVGATSWTVRTLAADYYFFRAEGYQYWGQLDQAIPMYEKAIALNPSQPFYRQYLATAYHVKAGEVLQAEHAKYWLGEAEAASLDALNLSPLNVDSRLELMRLSFLSGEPNRALGYGKAVLDMDPYSYDAHKHLGLIYVAEGDLSKAVRHLEIVKVIDPKNARSRLLLAQSYEGLGNGKEAIREYRQVLKLDPNNAEARNALQRLLRQVESGAAF